MDPMSANNGASDCGNVTSRLASMSLDESSDESPDIVHGGLIPDEELAEAVKAGGRLGLYSHTCRLPDKRIVVKTGTYRLLEEAQTMRYVQGMTHVPVPEVYEVHCEGADFQILMEYVEGDLLEHAWYAMTNEEKASVLTQLRDYLRELRSFRASFVGTAEGGPVRDEFFEGSPNAVYSDENEFNTNLLGALAKDNIEDSEDSTQYMTFDHMFKTTMQGNRLVMTYNNLHPRNIIVRGSQVVAFTDWSQAGFLPDYWEYCRPYTRSWETCNADASFFTKERVLDQILTPRERELAVFQFRAANVKSRVYTNSDEPQRHLDIKTGIYVW
ncbi:kinase-like domain-containing protein [Hypoxylon cercidicola]|nr:kinase-like domain-containing protein [Hypoxylon cercidicola]